MEVVFSTIAIIAVVITIISTRKRLGNKTKGFSSQINGRLYVLSGGITRLDNGKKTRFKIYERGISISQGLTSVEAAWDAVYSIKTAGFGSIINKDKSLINKSAVGGLRWGDIGAIIGGLSKTLPAQKKLGSDLFVIEFDYGGYGRVIYSAVVESGLSKFMQTLNGYKRYKKTTPDDIYTIGTYEVKQYIENKKIECANSVEYDRAKEQIIIRVDGRNASFKLHLNKEQTHKFKELLEKVIAWQKKAIENKLSADKEVGTAESKISLSFNNTRHYVDNGFITVYFKCWFDDYDEELEIEDNLNYLISISTPNITIAEENVQIPGSQIFIDIPEINNLLNLISIENAEKIIAEQDKKTELIDDILN
ncbi:MAG: hypothetical protein LBP64_01560 [Tannerella sp.]|jgi:hypothetical protein|nr:hypothetical protein [Tannerella sp.]